MVLATLAALALWPHHVRTLTFDVPVRSAAFDGRGRLFVGTDSGLIACDAATGEKTTLLSGTDATVAPIVAPPSGGVAFGVAPDELRRWTASQGVVTLRRVSQDLDDPWVLRAVSASGRTLALARGHGALAFCRVGETEESPRVALERGFSVVGALAMGDDRCAYSLGKTLCAFDVATRRSSRLGETREEPFSLHWVAGGARLLAIGPEFAELVDASTGRSLARRTLAARDDPVEAACRPSRLGGTWVLTNARAEFLGDDLTLSAPTPLRLEPTLGSVASSADGRLLAACRGRTVRLASVQPGSQRRRANDR